MTRPEEHTLSVGAQDPLTFGGRYRVQRLLGRGSSKEVYLARDLRLKRDVAIGVFAGRLGADHERVLHEVRTLASVDAHPSIATVHDLGTHEGVTFIVSQYMAGGSVSDRIAEAGGPLPLADALRIARDTAAALAHVHERGVLHRDVKPSNVWLDEQGAAILGDFGAALMLGDPGGTTDRSVVGTLAYMSPEQALGDPVTAATDLYALGAMLYEMTCGTPPGEGRSRARSLQQLHQPPPDPRIANPALPGPVADLTVQLLARHPEDRPASAAAVRRTLERLLADLPATPGPEHAPPPMPEPLDVDRPFVGRRGQLTALETAWQRAREGETRLVVVAGEAGIGKTHLAAAFAQRIHAEQAVVLYGRCDEDALVHYQPFVEALRYAVDHSPGRWHELDPTYAREFAVISQLVPRLRGRLPEPGPETPVYPKEVARFRLFTAAVMLLDAVMAARPMLLVIDDLQWADRPTAALLGHFITEATNRPFLIVATLREAEGLPPQHPIGALQDRLRTHPKLGRFERLTLTGLDEADIRSLMGPQAAGAGDSGFLRALHERTQGNPLFIEQTLQALAGKPAGTESLDEVGVPAGALGVIERRLALLSPAASELLTVAAVCGAEARIGLLSTVLGVPASQLVLRPFQEALDAGLVEERGPSRFTFRHALVREALYRRRLSDLQRPWLHLEVARALEAERDDRGDRITELALHYYAAREVGGAEQAVDYLVQASKLALVALAYEEAAQRRRDAISALDLQGPGRDAERWDLLHALGRIEWQLGESEAARHTYDEAIQVARRLDDPERFARAALGFAGRSYDAGRVDERQVGFLEEALRLLPKGDSVLRARVLARLAEALHFVDDGDRPQACSREALAMARRTQDRQALMAALAGRHTALLHIQHLPERLEIGQQWLALSEACRHRDVTAQALHWRVYGLCEQGDLDAAAEARERLQVLADELRQPLYRHFAAAWEAKWLEMAGDFDGAVEKADESYEQARKAKMAYADSNYAGQLFGLHRDQGSLEKLEGKIKPLIGDDPHLAVWRTGLVLTYLESGDKERAAAQLAKFTAHGFRSVPPDLFWLGAMCLLAETSAALGDREASATLREQLRPYAAYNAQIGLAVAVGPVHRFLGLLAGVLGDVDAAVSHFHQALDWSSRNGFVTAEAHVQYELGALTSAIAPERSRALLDQARDTARRLGMAPLKARAEALLG